LRVADWKFEFGGRLYWFEFFDKDFWKIWGWEILRLEIILLLESLSWKSWDQKSSWGRLVGDFTLGVLWLKTLSWEFFVRKSRVGKNWDWRIYDHKSWSGKCALGNF
jgi:hypothetical protein